MNIMMKNHEQISVNPFKSTHLDFCRGTKMTKSLIQHTAKAHCVNQLQALFYSASGDRQVVYLHSQNLVGFIAAWPFYHL